MASKIDQAFIDNLQNFTSSLESIVDIMKEQADKGDAVNKMLSAMDGPKMSELSQDMKSIIEVNKKIDDRTKRILEEVKASRKQRESGMFGEISDSENKGKIVDGVKVIGLIAGGVLSIGMAFKLVGDVDFVSVIALSMGIVAISYAFTEIAKMKELTPKKAATVGLAVVIMAGAITASSYVLKGFQPLDPIRMFSFVLVSAALGIGSYFMFKAVSNMDIKPKDMPKFLLLPVLLPAIAGGIVASSFLLKEMQPIGFDKIGSVIVTGIALVVGAYAVTMVMNALGGKDGKVDYGKLAAGVLALPLIAGSIVASSYILNEYSKITDPFGLIFTSLAMGVSILAFTPSVMLLGKLDIKSMATGVLGTVLVSTAIMASSWILSIGEYKDDYPSLSWSSGVGLSLLAFSVATIGLGVIAMSGIGAVALVAGAALTLVVAASIAGVSHVLNMGDYRTFPPLEWAIGTSLLMATFGAGMLALGIIPFGGKILKIASERMDIVAQAIVNSSKILGSGSYTGGPTREWAEGISLAIGAYALAISSSLEGGLFQKELKPDVFSNFIKSVAQAMVDSADILAQGNWSGGYPTKEWGEGVGKALIPFTDIFVALNERKSFMSSIFGGGNDDSFSVLMRGIAHAMVDVANILATGNFNNPPGDEWSTQIGNIFSAFSNNVPDEDEIERLEDFIDVIQDFSKAMNKLKESGIDKLGKLTGSVTIMSAVDDKRLESVINVLDNRKDDLSNAIDGQNTTQRTSSRKQKTIEVTTKTKSSNKSLKDKQDVMIEKYDEMLFKMDELLEYVIQSKGGENVGSNDSTKSVG